MGRSSKTIRLSRYIKRIETVFAASVAPIFKKKEEERGECMRQAYAQLPRDVKWGQENVSDIFKSTPSQKNKNN